MSKQEAPELSPSELATVERFGLDRPEPEGEPDAHPAWPDLDRGVKVLYRAEARAALVAALGGEPS